MLSYLSYQLLWVFDVFIICVYQWVTIVVTEASTNPAKCIFKGTLKLLYHKRTFNILITLFQYTLLAVQ